ncbi:MAG: TldD/PmbA family protein [Candidatus Heimdallarchaeota archaeon]
MIDYIKQILEKVKLGKGEFVDVRLQQSESITMQVQNGVTQEMTSTKLGGVAVRALIKGAWGFSTTAEVTKERIKEILDVAIKMAKVASEKVKKPRRIDENFVNKGKFKLKMDLDPKDVSIEEKLKMTQQFEESIRKVDERIANANSRYGETINHETIINSNGTEVSTESGAFRLIAGAVSREGTLQQRVSADVASAKGLKEIMNFNVVEKGTETGEKAIELLGAEKPPGGKMNIIMDPSLVGVFIHEAWGHANEADGILTKNSILHDKLGKKVADERLSISDDPTLEGLRGSFAFDSEGTPTRPRKLVVNGVCKEYFHTLETATLLGLEPNGAGRAMDFRYPPIPRMGNTYVEAGDHSFDELLEVVGDGIFLEHSYGGYVNPAKGQFMFSAQNGRLIKNGELTALTQNVSMSGLTLEIVNNVLAIGNDKQPAFNGTCGKDGQWVPVTGGGPSLAVRDVVVGGR